MKRLLLASLLLAGCSQKLLFVPTPEPPAALTQQCPELPELKGKSSKVILRWAVQVVEMYNTCKGRHNALSAAFAPKD